MSYITDKPECYVVVLNGRANWLVLDVCYDTCLGYTGYYPWIMVGYREPGYLTHPCYGELTFGFCHVVFEVW